MSKCFSCNRDLTKERKKFEWYLLQGYDPKDAASLILRDPESRLPPKQCCIVALETNIDVEDPTKFYEEHKHDSLSKFGQPGEVQKRKREIFILFPISSTNTAAEWLLVDANFHDMNLLASSSTDKRQTGHLITNITTIPESLRSQKGWKNPNATMLWSSDIKIVPIHYVAGENADAGYILWRDTQTGRQEPLNPSDASFLNCRIIEYSPQTIQIVIDRGQSINISLYALIVEKEYPEDNYYL